MGRKISFFLFVRSTWRQEASIVDSGSSMLKCRPHPWGWRGEHALRNAIGWCNVRTRRMASPRGQFVEWEGEFDDEITIGTAALFGWANECVASRFPLSPPPSSSITSPPPPFSPTFYFRRFVRLSRTPFFPLLLLTFILSPDNKTRVKRDISICGWRRGGGGNGDQGSEEKEEIHYFVVSQFAFFFLCFTAGGYFGDRRNLGQFLVPHRLACFSRPFWPLRDASSFLFRSSRDLIRLYAFRALDVLYRGIGWPRSRSRLSVVHHF